MYRHRGNMHLASLPLLSVRRHGNVNSMKLEVKFNHQFPLHSSDCDKCFHQSISKYRGFTIEFLGQVLTFDEREDELQ